jgi:hypothetical protein
MKFNRLLVLAAWVVGLFGCRVYEDGVVGHAGGGGRTEETGGAGEGGAGGKGSGTLAMTGGGEGGSLAGTATGGASGMGGVGEAGAGAGGSAGRGSAGGAGGAGIGGSGAGGGGAGGGGRGGAGGVGPGDAGAHDAASDDVRVDVATTGAVFTVGTFVKAIGVGPQVVAHALGRGPKALILWTVGASPASPSTDSLHAIGVSDGLRSSMSAAMASHGGVTPTSSSRRMANKALTIARWDLVTLAEADLTAWDAGTFTLEWTANGDTPYAVHYALIGGDGVSAKVLSWQAPTALGPKAVGGVGFQPDVVFHFHAGWYFTGAPPATITNAGFGLGVMDRAGGQCANHIRASDAKTPSLTARAQRTDSSVYMTHEVGPIVTKQASFVSMDNDGFTMNFTTANSSATQIFSLALGGVRAKVGAFAKTTGGAPSRQPIVGTGMRPGLVLLSSVQDVAETAITVDHLRYGMGAAEGAHEVSSALVDTHGVSPSAAAAMDVADTAFVKVSSATRDIEARADVQSLDPDGFTLNWTSNDPVATQFCYVAIGAR